MDVSFAKQYAHIGLDPQNQDEVRCEIPDLIDSFDSNMKSDSEDKFGKKSDDIATVALENIKKSVDTELSETMKSFKMTSVKVVNIDDVFEANDGKQRKPLDP